MQESGSIETKEARFYRLVISPLVNSGARKPHRYTVEEWRRELDELGRDYGDRSGVELEEAKRRIRAALIGKAGRTFPAPLEIRKLAEGAFRAHFAETGGNAEADDRAAGSILRVWRDGRGVMGPRVLTLRRSAIAKILAAEDGPSIEDLRRAGHKVDDDFARIGGAHA